MPGRRRGPLRRRPGLGEARVDAASHPEGGAAWTLGPIARYRRPLQHAHGRGMSSPMPPAPIGTLTDLQT